jgi:hypothetical protein
MNGVRSQTSRARARNVRAISHTRVKIDARVLADLLAADLIPEVWIGDDRCGRCAAWCLAGTGWSSAARRFRETTPSRALRVQCLVLRDHALRALVFNELNMRWSILFHFDVPGGKWQTASADRSGEPGAATRSSVFTAGSRSYWTCPSRRWSSAAWHRGHAACRDAPTN